MNDNISLPKWLAKNNGKPHRMGKKKFAKMLRRRATKGEVIFKKWLEKRNVKHFFQHVMFGYIADFYLPHINTIFELDGKYHQNETVYLNDRWRDAVFFKNNVSVLRIDEDKYLNSDDGSCNKWLADIIGCEP